MADSKSEPKLDSPEVVNLKEREKILVEKAARLEAMDANELARSGRDINELKGRNRSQLEEVRKEIQRLSK